MLCELTSGRELLSMALETRAQRLSFILMGWERWRVFPREVMRQTCFKKIGSVDIEKLGSRGEMQQPGVMADFW